MAVAHQRRLQSTKAPDVSTTFLTLHKKQTFGKNWLSDPSTYPLIATLGVAMGLCGGVAVYFLTSCKDVQIDTTKRASIIRTWGSK